jgi:hypothetical protein
VLHPVGKGIADEADSVVLLERELCGEGSGYGEAHRDEQIPEARGWGGVHHGHLRFLINCE